MTQNAVTRCWWCADHADYQHYHDNEWGYPVIDERHLFEKLCLEGFQSGLSWLTILRKRVHFRTAFAEFDIDTVAEFNEEKVVSLLADATIVRHRKKIESTINNAQKARLLRDEWGSLAAYCWHFEPKQHPVVKDKAMALALPIPPEARAMAKDLKRRGWCFIGPTTVYAFMQSMGLVNDHLQDCWVWQAVEQQRTMLQRPTQA